MKIRAAHLLWVAALPALAWSPAAQTRIYHYPAEDLVSAPAQHAVGLGDVDGDGFDDFVLGDIWNDVATVRSGYLGEPIYELSHPSFRGPIANVGDVNSDGIADVAVGGTGTVFLFSGADGAPIRDLDPVPVYSSGPNFPTSIAGAGDYDGDGCPDVVIGDAEANTGIYHSGLVYVYSGCTGEVLDMFVGKTTYDHLGGQVVGLGDVDGDGLADVAATSIDDNVFMAFGYIQIYGDGEVLYELTGDATARVLGQRLASGEDLDDDGIWDLAAAHNGGVRFYSGASGDLLYDLAYSGGVDALDFIDDLDGDDVADILIGSDGFGSLFIGHVEIFSSSTGGLITSVEGAEDYDYFGISAMTIGDVNGDGVEDFLAGAWRGTVPTVGDPPYASVYSPVGLPSASSAPIGTGCGAGSSGQTLDVPPPVLLDTLDVTITGVPGSVGALIGSPGPPHSQPLGACEIFVDPRSSLIRAPVATNAAGQGSWGDRVVLSPSMAGLELTFQAWLVGPGASGPGHLRRASLHVTNGVAAVLGF